MLCEVTIVKRIRTANQADNELLPQAIVTDQSTTTGKPTDKRKDAHRQVT